MARLRRLLNYAGRQKAFLVLVPGLTLLSSLITALQPWPLKSLMDNVLGSTPLPAWALRIVEWFAPEPTPLQLVGLVVAAGLLIFVLHSVVDYALTWLWTRAGRRMVFDLAESLFSRILERPLVFHRRNAVGDLMARVVGDSWVIHHLVDTLFFAPFHALLTTLVTVVFMVQLDANMTILALMAAPVSVFASLALGSRLREVAERKRDIEVRLQSHIQQTLAGISVVQAFACEERENAQFAQFADATVRAQQGAAFAISLNGLSSGLAAALGTGAVMWFGAWRVIDGTLSIGGLLVFLAYLSTLETQVKAFASVYSALQGFKVSLNRVNEILETPAEVSNCAGAVELPRIEGHVAFQNVSFGYRSDRLALQDINLEVYPGQVVAIVGLTGAGKSTLVGLIPRFLDPTKGEIRIDGHNLRDVKLKSLRDQIALVPQDSLLLPLTIAENIAFGRPLASRAEIELVARAANAHEFIMRLPEGYDTGLGERGSTLSGGERQRLCIARALLRDARIVILDEPTSALDTQSEAHVIDALDRLMKGRTTFIIAHRLSTVRRADQIVVLHEGRVVEAGAHEELLARGGRYAEFQRRQSASALISEMTK